MPGGPEGGPFLCLQRNVEISFCFLQPCFQALLRIRGRCGHRKSAQPGQAEGLCRTHAWATVHCLSERREFWSMYMQSNSGEAHLLNDSHTLVTQVLSFFDGVDIVRGIEGVIFTWVRSTTVKVTPYCQAARTADASVEKVPSASPHFSMT